MEPIYDVWPEPDDFRGPITSSTKNDHEHDYEFKYVKERATEEGNLIRQDHYFCRRCLEEKVIELE